MPSGDGLGCRGCGGGTYGAPGACAACPPTALCPGLLSAPLLNFSAAAAAAPRGCPFLAPLPAAGGGGGGGGPLPPALLAQAVGGALLGLLLLAAAARSIYHRMAGCKLPGAAKALAHSLDLLSPTRPVTVGADKLLAQRESSTLGFAMSLFAVGALGVLAAVLAANRAASNTLSQQSLGALRDTVAEEAAGLPFAANASVPGVAGAVSGLLLRFTASGEPLACLPVAGALQSSGLSQGAWALLPPPTCTAACTAAACPAPLPVDQFTLACPNCVFSAASALSFTLPYSCQSILAEAGAVDADGSFATLALPPAAGSPGALLSSITWNLAPLLSLLKNNMDKSLNRRGWQLLSQGFSLGPLQQLVSANGQLSLQPLPSGVRVTVSLALQPFAATTTLTELQTVLQLVSRRCQLYGRRVVV